MQFKYMKYFYIAVYTTIKNSFGFKIDVTKLKIY